jgi:aryl-alcohol dehydrogenase-like predicted oxidoreductase
MNLFFAFGVDTQMITVLKDVFASQREKYVLVTGAYNYIFRHQNLRKTLEKRLRQFRTDYIDAFLFLGVRKARDFPPSVHNELRQLKEEGKVKAIGISCHDRRFAGHLVWQGALDLCMIRYNAAHRGAEQDIFPFVGRTNPGIIGYTATRWRYLLRRPKHWPKTGPVPDAGMCYRFVLSNPHVHACLTAPRSDAELRENIAALARGPLDDKERLLMTSFGDAVYRDYKWFM